MVWGNKGFPTVPNRHLKSKSSLDLSLLFLFNQKRRLRLLVLFHNDWKMENTLIPKFIPMPIWMLDEGYWLLEACIIGYVDFYTNKYNKDFYCTNVELARLLHTSEATVKRALKNLKANWLIETWKWFREWGWTLRKIQLAQNEPSQKVNMTFPKGSIWAFHNINQEKKEIEKKENPSPSSPTRTELLEAYRNDSRLNWVLLEDDVVEWLKYKENKKELYPTVKWFIQQLVVVKKTITQWRPQLDIAKRFNFAVNNSISMWWKGIKWYEQTEREYVENKKILYPNENEDE